MTSICHDKGDATYAAQEEVEVSKPVQYSMRTLSLSLPVLAVVLPQRQKNPAPASADKQILHIPVEGGDFDSLDPALTSGGLGDPYNIIFTDLGRNK
jgi:hypothetical protein